MPKQARLNRIKAFRCYTIDEAAEISGVSPRTIRTWTKKGLAILQSERPVLVRGDALRDFIKAQRKQGKQRLEADRFYCMRCHAPRRAAGNLVECQNVANRLVLIAMCDTCETLMRKPVARANLSKFRDVFELLEDEGRGELSAFRSAKPAPH